MEQTEWGIGAQGRAWQGDEALQRHNLLPEPTRIEMHQGKLFWSDKERLTVIAMLMENLGIDKIAKLIDPELYVDALNKENGESEKLQKLIKRINKYK